MRSLRRKKGSCRKVCAESTSDSFFSSVSHFPRVLLQNSPLRR